MTDFKLVPVVPTSEMLAAGKYALEFGCYASGIYADMLAAAPQYTSDVTKLVEALRAAQKEAVYGLKHARNSLQASAALGRISAIVEAAITQQAKRVLGPRTVDTMSIDSNSMQEQFSNIDTDTFCAYCGGNDEEPQNHCVGSAE